MSTATAEPTATQLSQLEQLKKLTVVVADTGRFRIDQRIQASGCDDKPVAHLPGGQ
jgi:hypothetical protein